MYYVKDNDLAVIMEELSYIQSNLNKLFVRQNGTDHLPQEALEIASSIGKANYAIDKIKEKH